MSGRDLRTFLSSHRSGTFHTGTKTGLQYSTGILTAPKIAPVDYDQLLSSVKQQKLDSDKGFRRFKKLSKQGKQSKETSVLKKHHDIWVREKARLADLKTKTQAELNFWRSDILTQGDDHLSEIFAELTEYESQLYDERQEFEGNTVDPVWSLRVDLKTLIEDSSFPEADQPALTARKDILEELAAIKEQQVTIQRLLQEEYDMISSDLECFESSWGLLGKEAIPLVDKGVPKKEMVTKGVPVEMDCLECPDDKLRSDALCEFLRLDDQYLTLLDEWRLRNKHILELPHGGWVKSEAERFACILEQYPPTLANRRSLYLDRAMREFPSKGRRDIVDHESWFLSLKHYSSIRQSHINSWALHKQELVGKITTLFAQVKKMSEAQEIVRSERELQTQTCVKLYKKVQAWRREKVKVQQARAEKAAKLQALEEEQRKIVEHKCLRKRAKEKVEIQQYHTELDLRHQSELEHIQRLEVAIKKEKEELAVKNQERVEYRKEMFSERLAEAKEAQEQAQAEEREREMRLKQLRQQVQVNVSSDPERVLQETEASHARLAAQQDTELELQQPLYKLQSFPADKITSDPRIRLETALRAAGLHRTTYGRNMLLRIPPPLRPRPDQQSSLFKD